MLLGIVHSTFGTQLNQYQHTNTPVVSNGNAHYRQASLAYPSLTPKLLIQLNLSPRKYPPIAPPSLLSQLLSAPVGHCQLDLVYSLQ